MRRAIAIAIALCAIAPLSAVRAHAQETPARLVIPPFSDDIMADAVRSADDPQSPTPRPVAIEHSDAYLTRAKIHRYASFATLPLFATEYALGQSLYTDATNGGRKTAHGVVGAAIGGLFAVNSVTGIWNMWESRKEPAGRTLKMVHGILMLTADAGFVASTTSAPGGRNNLATFAANESRHRTIALTSMGIATASYLMMLFGNR